MNTTTNAMTNGDAAVTQAKVEPQMMQAIVQSAYGSTDVLRFGQIARPAIADNEVLVRTEAAGLDRGTWHLMAGRPYLMRVMGFGFSAPKNPVAGLDVAGTVAAVGAGVTRFKVGDAVFGIGQGSFAEYTKVREDKLAHKPASLSFERAAILGVSGGTALQGVRAARIEAGQRVLVIGASGGVGTYAVQIAKARGAVVTAVCSTGKLELVRSIGADHAIDYTKTDFVDGATKYDVIMDIGGNTPLGRLRRALTPTGTLVFVGGENGGDWTAGFGRLLTALMLSPFVKQRFVPLGAREHHEDLEELARLIEEGKVSPVLDRDRGWPLQEVPAAMEHLIAGRVRGKIAIRVGAQ